MNARSLSFDGMVELYDETRSFDEGCFSVALDYLVGRFPPKSFPNVFEPGIGSGRVAIPLANRGYVVTGVDISPQMLQLLERRQMEHPTKKKIFTCEADVTQLPFSDAGFDMAIAIHLFYFIPNWKQAVNEIIRVTKQNGVIVLMHTGTVMEIPELNERYKELCSELGVEIRPVGVKSTLEVVDYLNLTGWHSQVIHDRWTWTAQIRLDTALEYLRRRAYSFTTVAPDNIHLETMNLLREESVQRYGSLDTIIEVPNQISMVITQR